MIDLNTIMEVIKVYESKGRDTTFCRVLMEEIEIQRARAEAAEAQVNNLKASLEFYTRDEDYLDPEPTLAKMKTEIKRLRKALRPLANAAIAADGILGDPTDFFLWIRHSNTGEQKPGISVADAIEAKRVLEGVK